MRSGARRAGPRDADKQSSSDKPSLAARKNRSSRPSGRIAQVKVRRRAGYVEAMLDASAGNRLNALMAETLMELAEEVEDDAGVRLLAITGAPDAFCQGFDEGVDERLVATLAAISKPTLALIQGDALDEGLELAMALDLRLSIAGARLGMRQLPAGRLPRFGGTQRLARLVGGSTALRMLLSGETVSGRQAGAMGLVTYVARNPREFAATRDKLVAELLERAPIALRLVKEAVLKGVDLTLDQGIRLEEDLYALLQTTADRAEGISAFLAKRKPLFKGV